MRILLILVALPLAWAQFPAVCNTPDSLSTKTCCPDNCGSRGACVSIREKVEMSWDSANQNIVELVRDMVPQDVRYQWPLQIFERVCHCNKSWGGYDCSQCDFGYINVGGDCVKRNTNQLLMRKNFKTLTQQQKLDYIKVLKESKNEAEQEKEWAVVISEPNDIMNDNFTLQNVSTYDMFVAHHFLAGREKDNNMCKLTIMCPKNVEIDFAHERPTFLTWHRYYLLIVERELRRVAERIGVSNFNLVYWDWTPNDASLFSNQLFGATEYSSVPVNVVGSLFDTWPVVYDGHYREYLAQNMRKVGENNATEATKSCAEVRALRNIEDDRKENKRLERGRICDKSQFLPRDNSIMMALTADKYTGNDGFRNRLEGFVELCAGNTPMCTSGDGNNNLHNAVHIYLSGHMRDVPTASNDPIFFLHHANIDRIFEAWLRKSSASQLVYSPASGEHPGHNRNDYLVPFFPLKTNANMYKISSELGFSYDSLPWNIDSTVSDLEMCGPNTTCDKGGYFPNAPALPMTCPEKFECPNADTSIFHIPLHLIWISGTSVLMVLKLFSM